MIIILVMDDANDVARPGLQPREGEQTGNGDNEASSSMNEESDYTDGSPSSTTQEHLPFFDGIPTVTDILTDAKSTAKPETMETSDIISEEKEGWLKYKQLLTEKGKRTYSSMRPWKRVYTVLRSQSLRFYKNTSKADEDVLDPVDIRDCLVDVAYGETKHKHTLRLITQNFCEYLLEAESCADMLSWINGIREMSENDKKAFSFSGQALINKKMNDYRKQRLMYRKHDNPSKLYNMVPSFLLTKASRTSVKRSSRNDENKGLCSINMMTKRKKTGCPQVLGVCLEDSLLSVNHNFVPLIVEMCCGLVEASGLDCIGIYRIPGNSAMIANLLEHLNMGLDINAAEERWRDINVISSVLKAFFRNLPEPLLTAKKYMDFINANRVRNTEHRLKTIKKLIHSLPDHHYHTLKFLVGHLKRVDENSQKNKMDARNLALVFGPTLVRSCVENMTEMVTHMPDQYMIVEAMLLHYNWIFREEELKEEDEAPEEKLPLPPIPNISYLLHNITKPGMTDGSDSVSSMRTGTLRR